MPEPTAFPLSNESCPFGSRCPCGPLSRRQREVFHRLLLGDGEKQAAAALGLSGHTAHSHAKNIYHQFKVSGEENGTV